MLRQLEGPITNQILIVLSTEHDVRIQCIMPHHMRNHNPLLERSKKIDAQIKKK